MNDRMTLTKDSDGVIPIVERSLLSARTLNTAIGSAYATRATLHLTRAKQIRDTATEAADTITELVGALTEIAREQSARTATEAADCFQEIGRRALAKVRGNTGDRG